MDLEDKKNLFKVRKTALEMISDRGYAIPQNESNISFEQFEMKYNNKTIDIYIDDTLLNKRVYVHFYNENKNFSKNDLKILIQKLMASYNDENMSIIIILKDKENSAITKELVSNETYSNIEIFLKKNMLFNITHHNFVPHHSVLSKEEEVILLEKYNTSKSKLPKIARDDPVIKYYGFAPDQICKIMRKSPEVGEYPYYRVIK